MSVVRFIGCLHLGHKWMAQHRGFQDDFYHDEHLIEQWNSVVGKRDVVYILGDVTMESSKPYPLLDRLNGSKIVSLGNHDSYKNIPELLKYVKGVAGAIDYKQCMLTHVPIHPNEVHFYRRNIHAHIHENELHEVLCKTSYNDPISVDELSKHKYINVDAHKIGYKPKP